MCSVNIPSFPACNDDEDDHEARRHQCYARDGNDAIGNATDIDNKCLLAYSAMRSDYSRDGNDAIGGTTGTDNKCLLVHVCSLRTKFNPSFATESLWTKNSSSSLK